MYRFLTSPLLLASVSLPALFVACGESEPEASTPDPVFEEFRGVFDIAAYESGDCSSTSDALDELEDRTLMIAYSVVPTSAEVLRISDCASVDECSQIMAAGLENRRFGDESVHTITQRVDDETAIGRVAHGGIPNDEGECTGRVFDELELTRNDDESMTFVITRFTLPNAPLDSDAACPADFDAQQEEAENLGSGGASSDGGAGGVGGSSSEGHCALIQRYTLTPI